MTRSGQTINATVTYTAASQNAFGPMFGVSQINMNGKAASSLTMGKYLDFYLLLDVSGSMGVPSTNASKPGSPPSIRITKISILAAALSPAISKAPPPRDITPAKTRRGLGLPARATI
jgi:hypothetical protein